MSHLDSGQHIRFRALVGFPFDHDDVFLRGRDDEVEVGGRQYRFIGIDAVLPVYPGHAYFGDGALEGDIGYRERGRCCQGGKRIGQHVFFCRDQIENNLGIVHIPVREQRPDGAVHEAGDQHLIIGELGLAAEKVAGNPPRCSKFFLIVHGEREEVLTFADVL